MRFIEIITEHVNPLFADTSVKLPVDPETQLYLKPTKQALKDKSAYFGAVWKDNGGKFSAQMHITNAAKDALANSPAISRAIKEGKLSENLLHVDGRYRPTLSFGYFDDERQAAYALQKIRFSNKHDDYAVEYLVEKLNGNLNLPWHEAIEGMPEFHGSPIDYKEYRAEDYEEVEKRQTQQSNIEKWLENNKQKLKKKISAQGNYPRKAAEQIINNFQELHGLFRQEIESQKKWPKVVSQVNLPEVYALTWFLQHDHWLQDGRIKDLVSKYHQ